MCSIPETSYARTVHRAFMACITVLLQGRTIEVEYVRAKHSAIQALYNSHRRLLTVAHQWLDFAGSHRPVFCREILSSKLGGQSFFCDDVDFRDNALFCDHVTCCGRVAQILPCSAAGAVRGFQNHGSDDPTENTEVASAYATHNHCVEVVPGWGIENYVGRQRDGVIPQTLYA